jgi:hypothetical protein
VYLVRRLLTRGRNDRRSRAETRLSNPRRGNFFLRQKGRLDPLDSSYQASGRFQGLAEVVGGDLNLWAGGDFETYAYYLEIARMFGQLVLCRIRLSFATLPLSATFEYWTFW